MMTSAISTPAPAPKCCCGMQLPRSYPPYTCGCWELALNRTVSLHSSIHDQALVAHFLITTESWCLPQRRENGACLAIRSGDGCRTCEIGRASCRERV